MYQYTRAHQTRWSGRPFTPWFQWNHPIPAKRWSFIRPVSLWSLFLLPISIFFLQYSHKRGLMFLKFDQYRVWYSIFCSKLIDCILLKIVVQNVCFVKGRGHAVAGKEMLKFASLSHIFPHFVLKSTKREVKSSLFLLSVVSPVHKS